MPEPSATAIAAFVAEHHVEQEFFKRERDAPIPRCSARPVNVKEDEE